MEETKCGPQHGNQHQTSPLSRIPAKRPFPEAVHILDLVHLFPSKEVDIAAD